ncbi:aldehyde dehydrogenase family protein [Aquitalea aquatica]|uniref:Aldehyde dehydrogenase family protein n=1 Tax=Aquitalea aquatica TaxID=3044273 RepID=A0A838Y1W6_9NEIS|nr:aldehyde dehydrogenase family protein [Aquitalea magnusonii]MBA4707262.1 aldehyde dehydrogenase family protein [Aquitalea magnusonii]
MEVRNNYINGQWQASVSGATREVINPSNGEVIALVTDSVAEDSKQAIAAAKAAFYQSGAWRRMAGPKRADLLLRIADAIAARADELAVMDTLDNGKPLREARCDVDDAAACFRYYAGLITKPQGGVYEVSDGFGPMHAYSMHEPVGVCALITPWNYPLLMAAWKLAPALAAGNAVVFKPSEVTPLSAVALFEIFHQVGLPAGTANLVLGSGPAAGQELAASHDVDMITFTGSTRTGQTIAAAAVGNLKKVGLELGGKSPNVIFADADLEGAVEWAMIGVFFNQGEVCSAGSRILIEESIKDRFVARLAERARAMSIGPGMKDPDMGAIVSAAQLEKVLGHIERAKQQGATLVCGGVRHTAGECAKGYFVQPTIFDNCTRDMDIVREEVFGPVVAIQTFTSEAEAIAMANDTPYGLAGGVFTTDGARALRVVKEIRAGVTWINCYNPTFNEAPWGGYKMSGYGRDLGVNGLLEYQQVKQVNINLQPGPVGWYQR